MMNILMNIEIRQSSDRLKFISNFSGSAGFAIILKNRNYLFVDGRYTIQARIQVRKKLQNNYNTSKIS